MEKYTEAIQHLEKLAALLAPQWKIPEAEWTLQQENIIPGPFGEEEKIWLRGKKGSGFYGTVTTSFDEESLPEETHALIWAAGLPENISASIQCSPDIFDPELEQISLNLTAPTAYTAGILAIETLQDDGFQFFRKLAERCFPEFAVEEKPWDNIEAPDPLDDSQSSEGVMVQVMGTEEFGFRKTVESPGEDNSAGETVIFTASGLPSEAEMTMFTRVPPGGEEQQFNLHITTSGEIFKKIMLLLPGTRT